MSEVINVYFNIGSDCDTNKLKEEILEAYSKHDKVRMIYDLQGKKVSFDAMMKIKRIFDDIGVDHLEETCIISKEGFKTTLIKNFLKLVKTKRPVRFI